MRLLTLILAAVVLSATLIWASQNDLRARATAYFTDGITRDISFPVTTSGGEDRTARVNVMPTTNTQPVILSGFDSYQTVQFALPQDVRILGGRISFVVTAQVSDGAQGMIRANVSGTRRAEMLLVPGMIRERIAFDLTAQDLASDHITVSLSLVGEDREGQCRAGSHMAAVVSLDPETHLALDLEGMPKTPRDRFAVMGEVAHVDWVATLSAQDRNAVIREAANLMANGAQVVFDGDAGPSTPAAMTAADLAILRAGLAPQHMLQLPEDIASTGSLDGLRRFDTAIQWRHQYSLDQIGDGPAPDQLSFSVLLGPLPNGGQWIVSTTLNRKLIDVAVTDGGAVDMQRLVDLPRDLQSTDNVLEIDARRPDVQDVNCADMQRSMGELRSAVLQQTTQTAPNVSSGLAILRGAIADAGFVLANDGLAKLSAVEAEQAAHLVAQILPFADPARQARPLQITVLQDDTGTADDKAAMFVGYDATGGIIALPKSDDISGLQNGLRLVVSADSSADE